MTRIDRRTVIAGLASAEVVSVENEAMPHGSSCRHLTEHATNYTQFDVPNAMATMMLGSRRKYKRRLLW